jgi:hypothetical protein
VHKGNIRHHEKTGVFFMVDLIDQMNLREQACPHEATAIKETKGRRNAHVIRAGVDSSQ